LHALWRRFGANNRVRFARLRALFWAGLGVASFPLGWANSVVLVWIASAYANSESSWSSGEAADNRDLISRLDRQNSRLDEQDALLREILATLRHREGVPQDGEQTTTDEAKRDDRDKRVSADLA
jgi:hypothetical protein